MIRFRKRNVVVAPSLAAPQKLAPEEPEIIDEIAEAFAAIEIEQRKRAAPSQSSAAPRPESDDDWETSPDIEQLPARR